jgi:glutamate 5-kinase
MRKGRIQVVKLGGSLLTYKDRTAAFRTGSARRLAREIAHYCGPVVLLHGTGSYGKPPARQYGYEDGFLPRSRGDVIAEVSSQLHVLRGRVLDVLSQAGVHVYGLSAAALFETRAGEVTHCNVSPVLGLVEREMVPVISGEIVLDHVRDFAVCSSDAMAARLAVELGAERLILATDTPGLMRCQAGRTTLVEKVSPTDPGLAQWIMPTDDVSGGMAAKLAAGFVAARAGIDTLIVDGRVRGRLLEALSGAAIPATRLLADADGRVSEVEGHSACAD